MFSFNKAPEQHSKPVLIWDQADWILRKKGCVGLGGMVSSEVRTWSHPGSYMFYILFCSSHYLEGPFLSSHLSSCGAEGELPTGSTGVSPSSGPPWEVSRNQWESAVRKRPRTESRLFSVFYNFGQIFHFVLVFLQQIFITCPRTSTTV